jgi:hypothetical protein
MMIDMAPFREIIHEWFEQRRCIETQPWCENTPDQLAARHDSLIGHLKVIIWQLKQQKKDVELLKDVLMTWIQYDRMLEQRNDTQERREQLLYMTLEDYLNGQGYPTALPLPDLS